jgi:hypothetical protein
MTAALAKTIADQERRYAQLLTDAQFVRRCREIDKLKGIEWADKEAIDERHR